MLAFQSHALSIPPPYAFFTFRRSGSAKTLGNISHTYRLIYRTYSKAILPCGEIIATASPTKAGGACCVQSTKRVGYHSTMSKPRGRVSTGWALVLICDKCFCSLTSSDYGILLIRRPTQVEFFVTKLVLLYRQVGIFLFRTSFSFGVIYCQLLMIGSNDCNHQDFLFFYEVLLIRLTTVFIKLV